MWKPSWYRAINTPEQKALRIFSCFITDEGSSTPTLSLVLTENEDRARELAQRELADARHPVAVDVYEGDKLLWTEMVQQG